MGLETQIYLGGLQDPVLDAQSTFRKLMNSFARPGTVESLDAPVGAPRPLCDVAGAIALTLCDHDTPVWLSPELQAGNVVGRWMGFHCGSPITADKSAAHFAIFSEKGLLPSLNTFAQGSQEYPDRSTTILLPVADIGKGSDFRLEGPGVNGSRSLLLRGLPDHFLEMWVENVARVPRGVDVILYTSESFVCLPRTTRLLRENAPCM